MSVDAIPMAPAAMDSPTAWETFLQSCLSRRSGCRVRSNPQLQTAAQREQLLLQRLSLSAKRSFAKTALAHRVPQLQRQILELIQMRRRVVPDDCASQGRGEIFLAIAALHRAVHHLLEQIDQYEHQFDLLVPFVERWECICRKAVAGHIISADDLFGLNQQIRSVAADGSISPAQWLELSINYAQFETEGWTADQKQSLTTALQSGYLAAGIFRHSRWLIDVDAMLSACLFKDVAWFLPEASPQFFTEGHHAEWSAGLMGQCERLGVDVPRLIRQHHECLDGSGLPLGITAGDCRRDARLLMVLTRWTELSLRFQQRHNPQLTIDHLALSRPLNVIAPEAAAGRWDVEWLNCLVSQLGLKHPDLTPTETARSNHNANPHWKIPRPHFLKRRSSVRVD